MSANGRYKINSPKIVHETIDGETVILNLDNGNYYSLTGIGADIWDDLEKGIVVDRIIEKVLHAHHGDKEDIEAAVHRFLSELIEENLTAPCSPDDGITPEDTQPEAGVIKVKRPFMHRY